MTKLTVIKPSTCKGAIEYARELLARCELGEVIAVTSVEEHPGGTYSLLGSATTSRTQTAGMLLDAALMRLLT